MKNKILSLSLLLFPAITFAGDLTFRMMSKNIYDRFVNSFISIIFVFALIFLVFGIFSVLMAEGDRKEIMKNRFGWGTLAFVLMFSVWGILSVINGFFFKNEISDHQQYKVDFMFKSSDYGIEAGKIE